MMKHKFYSLLGIIVFGVITLLLYISIRHAAMNTIELHTKLISRIFQETILQDMELKMKGDYYFNSKGGTNNLPTPALFEMNDKKIEFKKDSSVLKLTAAQKDFLVTQLYLLTENRIHASTIDSLFRVNLKREGIPIHTAVLYQARFGEKAVKEYSRTDSTYYQSALALPPVNMRLKQLDFEVYMQGFIKFPILYILGKIPHIGIILFAYLVGIFFIAWGLIGLRKLGQQAIPLIEPVEPELNPAEIRFADSFVINKDTGEIKKGDQSIGQLRQLRLEVFLLLLAGNDYFQDYETIKSLVWKNETVGKELINKTIARLREDLIKMKMPLDIKNIRNQGYVLVII